MSLVARQVSIVRNGRRILDAVSAELPGRGLVAVIGPNGAGKSTFLLALAGLVAPDDGAVTLDGAPLDGMQRKALARLRAYLPQNADCAWPISVASAVALGLTPDMPAVGGLAPADAARVAEALARADLADKADQAVTTLSGGERARAMLARAMVADPAILIADEPVAGLDPRHAIDCMGALRAHADRGRLVVVALHDLALAAQHADVVLALAGGRLVAAGAPEEVIAPDVLERLFGLPARVERDAAGASVRFSASR